MAWRYYDFDANWDKVYEVWQGDAVQNVLEPQMKEFLEKHPQVVLMDEEGHLRRPTWHQGDSLWRYGISYYPHGDSMMEAANTLVNSENVFGQLMAALRRHGLDFTENQLCQSEIWHRVFLECERRCEPKKGSLDSMIIFGGDDALEDAHFVLATQLFPEEQVVLAQPPGGPEYEYSHVFRCKQRLVFDIQGYW